MTDSAHTRSVSVGWLHGEDAAESREATALVIVWSATAPQRVGEIALLQDDAEPCVLGRGGREPSDTHPRLGFVRQRPGSTTPTPALEGPAISREQLLLRPTGGGLEIERLGRCQVSIGGVECERGVVRPGETLTLKHQLVLYCSRRPSAMAALSCYQPDALHPFGEPDPWGMVGESPAAWDLREQLAFSASADAHVLLLGESGSGKELAARTIHGLSPRAGRDIVSRNAATFPEGIIDAELFGNVRDYPNPGMEERRGIIGEADGSTLFLDEIAELPVALQGHLLRVLDQGEYQRLGESKSRRASFRLVAATNRDPSELKHDLVARVTLRVTLPGLGDRREDVPLIVRQLLLTAKDKSASIGERFFAKSPEGRFDARIDPDLVDALVRHRYHHHVREIERLLWLAIGESKGRYIALTPSVEEALDLEEPTSDMVAEPDAETIRSCLARHDGKVSRAFKELGLKSRYSLYRLMRKHGI